MKILLIEAFYTASHKKWADGLKAHSRHEVQLLTLAGRHWKWRMHGGAISLASEFKKLDFTPDLLLITEMMDVALFRALTQTQIPIALYFHENQLTYPWSVHDAYVQLRRDNHYAFINYTSALVADKVFFNSNYHKHALLEALPTFLKQFPDHRPLETITEIEAKSQVLPLALDLKRFDSFRANTTNDIPIILWNHRWEYDKNPEDFFRLLFRLADENIDFQLVVLGESYRNVPAIFEQAKQRLQAQILHFGYVEDFATYANWLWKADIALTTSNQDFFGGSVVEAISCGCLPILPNRLAYPEHIPRNLHSSILYDSLETAYSMLKYYLLEGFKYEKLTTIAKYIQQYDWKRSAHRYDNLLKT